MMCDLVSRYENILEKVSRNENVLEKEAGASREGNQGGSQGGDKAQF